MGARSHHNDLFTASLRTNVLFAKATRDDVRPCSTTHPRGALMGDQPTCAENLLDRRKRRVDPLTEFPVG